jgi:hypothetical protein
MAATKPLYSKEEFARRGDALYEQKVAPVVTEADFGKLVAIDIETGEFEIAADESTAAERLSARIPHAQTWMRKVGSPYIRRFGPSHRNST